MSPLSPSRLWQNHAIVVKWTAMKRRLFNILSAMSLLLCVALMVLWVRSYWVCDAVDCRIVWGGKTLIRVIPNYGRIWVYYDTSEDSPSRLSLQYRTEEALPIPMLSFANRCGFSYLYAGASPNGRSNWRAFVPYWLPTLASAVLPTAWLIDARRRKHRLKHGLCLTCGYDLRASKDRCPECGTPMAATGAR